jgi:hypothetical protein
MSAELKAKVQAAEAKLNGAQVTWASTPKQVPVLRGKALCSAIVGERRQYAFANESDREQFVYDRNDTLFTVSRDIRAQLGLGPVTGGGTKLVAWQSMWQGPAKGRTGTTAVTKPAQAPPPAAAAPAPAKPPAQAGAPSKSAVAAEPAKPAAVAAQPKANRFRKSANAT